MHEDFRNRINKAICVGFIDGDFLFLNFLCYFGTFIVDITKKWILYNK